MHTYLQQKEPSPNGFEPLNHRYFDAVVIPGEQSTASSGFCHEHRDINGRVRLAKRFGLLPETTTDANL